MINLFFICLLKWTDFRDDNKFEFFRGVVSTLYSHMKSVQCKFVYFFFPPKASLIVMVPKYGCMYSRALIPNENGWLFVIFFYIMIDEPGHCVFLQVIVSVSFPIQLLPPCNGAGFEQILWRVVVPSPHVTEHALKWVHTLQWPSTKKLSRMNKVKASYFLFI